MTRLAAAVLAALALAPLPAAAGEVVILLQTQETTDVTPVCPEGDNIRLGAYVYAPRTRADSGAVVRDLGPPIGIVNGCGRFGRENFVPYTPAPFSMRFELPMGTVHASGQCVATSLSFPVPGSPAPLLLVGCALDVTPDPALGVTRGSATSSSVFLPYPIPGYDTGSYWTLHLYTADAASQ
ncbi:MAG TPA: hypothetical protein VLS93_06870 [Anaeromyxobacteraceae bacterium]|nr:hypothetical protein [Anaeromyxobacteraceae bacterium]